MALSKDELHRRITNVQTQSLHQLEFLALLEESAHEEIQLALRHLFTGEHLNPEEVKQRQLELLALLQSVIRDFTIQIRQATYEIERLTILVLKNYWLRHRDD